MQILARISIRTKTRFDKAVAESLNKATSISVIGIEGVAVAVSAEPERFGA